MISKFEFKIPRLTTSQMIEVDHLMIQEYQIELIQMMENAGRNLAILAREYFLNNQPLKKRILVLAGSGGNGGGALVCARHLTNYGADVRVQLNKNPANINSILLHQLKIIQHMGIEVALEQLPDPAFQFDLIVDGLIGYSLKGSPRGITARLIEFGNQSNTPILSLDVPSGLDATSGIASKPTIKATATMTLALPKTGLFIHDGTHYSGKLFLADISVPVSLYARLSPPVTVPHQIFSLSEIIEI